MAWCVLQVQPPPPSPVQTLLVNSADTVTCLHPAPVREEDREEEGGEGRMPGGREKSDKEVNELIRMV